MLVLLFYKSHSSYMKMNNKNKLHRLVVNLQRIILGIFGPLKLFIYFMTIFQPYHIKLLFGKLNRVVQTSDIWHEHWQSWSQGWSQAYPVSSKDPTHNLSVHQCMINIR